MQALTKWGGALLELAHFRQGEEAYGMIEEAISKFEQVCPGDWAMVGMGALHATRDRFVLVSWFGGSAHLTSNPSSSAAGIEH
jgi:hypothetical protein